MKIKKLLFIPLLCLGFGVAVAVAPSSATVVKAEDEIAEVVPEAEEKSSVDEFKEEVNKFKETVVNPLIIFLGSLNFASIATVVIGVLVRHFANKKRDKKFDVNNATLDNLIATQQKLNEETEKAKDNAVELFSKSLEVLKQVIKIVEDIKKSCGQIPELKQSVISMAEALVVTAKSNPEIIKSGAMKQITEIQNRIAELGK